MANWEDNKEVGLSSGSVKGLITLVAVSIGMSLMISIILVTDNIEIKSKYRKLRKDYGKLYEKVNTQPVSTQKLVQLKLMEERLDLQKETIKTNQSKREELAEKVKKISELLNKHDRLLPGIVRKNDFMHAINLMKVIETRHDLKIIRARDKSDLEACLIIIKRLKETDNTRAIRLHVEKLLRKILD